MIQKHPKISVFISILSFAFCAYLIMIPAVEAQNTDSREKLEISKALRIAEDLQADGKLEGAIAAYEEILRKYPDSDMKNDILIKLAQSHNRLGDDDSAIQTYFRIISDDPDTIEASQAVSRMMSLYYQRYRFEDVMALSDHVEQQFPGTQAVAMALYRSAGYLYTQREYKKAIQRYENFMENFPKSIMRTTAFNRLISLYIRESMFDSAEELLMDKMSEDPEDKYMIRQLALVYQKQSNYDRALELYQQILKSNPNDVDTYERLGELYAEKGDKEKAISMWSKITESAPGQYSRHQMLAYIFKSHGFYDEAAREYQKAISLRPGIYYLHTQLADVYIIKKQFDAAINVYLDALIKLPVGHPDRPGMTTALLELCDLEGLHDKVAPVLTSHLARSPDSVPALLTLADFYFHRSDFRGSLQQFRKIASLYPDGGVILFDRAEILERQRNISYAVDFHQAIVDLFPQSSIALQSLFRVGKLKAELNEPQGAIASLRKLIEKIGAENVSNAEVQSKPDRFRSSALWLSAHILIGDIHLNQIHDIHAALAMYSKAKREIMRQNRGRQADHVRLPDLELKTAECYRLMAKYDEAEGLLDVMQAKYRTRSITARIAKLRGDCYFSQGDFDNSIKQYQEAIQWLMNEEWVNDALDRIALIKGHSDHSILKVYVQLERLIKLGQYDEALAVCKSAVERYSGSEDVAGMQFEMGKILALQMKPEEAISVYEKIVQTQSPLAPEAQFQIATLYWEQLRDPIQAMAAYSALIEDYPDSVLVANSRKQIRQLVSQGKISGDLP